MSRREFVVADEYQYDHRSPARWVASHVLRYPSLPIGFLLTVAGMAICQSLFAVQVGRAFDAIVDGGGRRELGFAALRVVAAFLGYGACDIVNSLAIRVLALRVERDAREEIYLSLLGKSQTFLGRQRTGDLMARATNDVQQIDQLSALGRVAESTLTLTVPLVTIGLMRLELLLVPVLFLSSFAVALLRYNRELRPLATGLRAQFGAMNAGLAEAISGIEVVKGFAQEPEQERRFRRDAGAYRDTFVREGEVQARYLPLLLYGLAVGLAFGHALWLFTRGLLSVGQVITFMTLLEILRFPTAELVGTSSILQQGFASARRILNLVTAETELDENVGGVAKPIEGEIRFERVSFGYGAAGGELDDAPAQPVPLSPSADAAGTALVLREITFTAHPGQTVAIIGQTGAGKTTLTRLVNRVFDATSGRVLVDGVDVRDWSLDSLRSQIATIEQDTFLFSRSIAENIAFGARGAATEEQIQGAARQAQAHEFILGLPDGYDTVVGERGVTLSGGQRQRIAIARAFLTDPRILVLDDSTSAVDSNTEDQIQQAMRRILRGRTTLLITHRLAQIRAADWVLVLRNGELIAQGAHDDLLATSKEYGRIFSQGELTRDADGRSAAAVAASDRMT